MSSNPTSLSLPTPSSPSSRACTELAPPTLWSGTRCSPSSLPSGTQLTVNPPSGPFRQVRILLPQPHLLLRRASSSLRPHALLTPAQVHPPLGKMLVGLAGALSGFNGSFDFPSGAVYPDHVPFRAMRVLLALPGIAMVPLAWGTAVELRFTRWSRHIVTLMVLCGESSAGRAEEIGRAHV